jgi:hypothetical protein
MIDVQTRIKHLQALARAERSVHPNFDPRTILDRANTPKNARQDRKRILLVDEHEVSRWMQSLGCREIDLRKAVAVVGASADAVRKHLAERR